MRASPKSGVRDGVGIAILAAVLFPSLGATSPAAEGAGAPAPADRVDYRYYALDSWVGAIGLPDDCFKATADGEGRFVTELGKSKGHQGFYPHPLAQSPVAIHADLAGGAVRMEQRMHSPRVPIALTRKRQGEVEIAERLFAARPLDWSARVQGAALRGRDSTPDVRQYLLMTEYTNRGTRRVELTPVLHVAGSAPSADLARSRTAFSVAANTLCFISHEIELFDRPQPNRAEIVLKKIALDPGATARWVLAINRNGFAGAGPVSSEEAGKLSEQAVAYWEHSAGLPYGVIQVPDPEIQALLDTSIRELYQMRYVINGLPAYFFGPGCYNDYWILDGSFVTEAMDMLGRTEDAAGYADYLLLHQQKDGRIQCMNEHWKETGIALVTLYRHARLVQDRAWLAARWPQVRRAVEAIKTLRHTGTSADPKALNYRLSPVGFGDGGIGREAEYTNNHWLLGGLKAAVEAAQWLGHADDAKAWDEEYRDFQQSFRNAIQRDAKTDALGNRYIPAVMGDKTPAHPTRGQWAFCQGVYPGRIFAKDDPLMLGTLKMLQAHEVQGGIVEDSGWIGIWAQCGSFYGHDWLWLDDGQKAARLLYAFANHASLLHNWREEMPRQSRPGERVSYGKGGGDMPHVSAAAEFLRLTGHLLAFDRDEELHLFEGLPAAWLKPGMTTRLDGLRSPFGPLRLNLKVADDGKTASLAVGGLSDPSCRKVVVHWLGEVRELDPRQPHKVVLPCSAPVAAPISPALKKGNAGVQAAPPDGWIQPMKEVHARFKGRLGTFAHFGDSITVSRAFWTGLQYPFKNAPPEMLKAHRTVKGYMLPACWDWKGPQYGNEGGMTIRWAHENVDRWLADLKPEVALIMFGTNDLGSLDLAEYESKTREVVRKCTDRGTIVILSTIPPKHGQARKATQFAEAVRRIAREMKVPLTDYQAEILKRRPDDWDGAMDKFKRVPGDEYNVPTLISHDGVHPSNPGKYAGDYSEDALRSNGYGLRSYVVLLKYAEVIDKVLSPKQAEGKR